MKNKNDVFYIPLHYNQLIQGVIYNSVSPMLSRFLHDKGFQYGKRIFKLFTFSRLLGRYKIQKNDKISFYGDIRLFISSPIERFIKEIANTFLKRGWVKLGSTQLHIESIEFLESPFFSSFMKIYMLSPITVYSTLYSIERKKKTYYYSPYEKEFSILIDDNAKKKHSLLYKREIKSSLKIKPIKVKEVILKYKDFVIKSWSGSFRLNGPKTLIKTVYETGLGSKNSQGFGMFEVIGE